MESFIEEFRLFKNLKPYGYYRFCWVPFGNTGGGFWSIIEFFDNEIHLIDKYKVEIVVL